MKHIPQTITFLLITICMLNCEQKIDFERPDSIIDGIVIQGKLVRGNPSKVEVSIRKVYNAIGHPQPLTAQSVKIVDEADNTLTLKSRATGVYNLEIPIDHPIFRIEKLKGYKIQVKMNEENIYESRLDSIFPVPKPDTLSAETINLSNQTAGGRIVNSKHVRFTVASPLRAQDAAKNSRLLWSFGGVFKLSDTPQDAARIDFVCTVAKDDVNKICYAQLSPVKNYPTFNGLKINADYVNKDILDLPIDYIFAEGFYLNVYQQSLSENAYTYWSRVGQVVNRTRDVFQQPIGNIPSNFQNINKPEEIVYGFFYATEEELLRIYVSPEVAESPTKYCPRAWTQFRRYYEECCNCTNFSESSIIKPDWWEM